MAIEPAVVRLPTIYQNAAYSVQMRLTDRLRPATIASDGLINCDCHGLSSDARVVLLSKNPAVSLCGVALNKIYYVSSNGLTRNSLRLSTATLGGTLLNITGAEGELFYIARPSDITGYSIDADICKKASNVRIQVATFTGRVEGPADGLFSLSLNTSTTVDLIPGDYAYDVSMTPPSGDRFYPVRGDVSVAVTRSRT